MSILLMISLFLCINKKKKKKTARQNEIAQSVVYNKNAQKFKNQNENALPVAINCGAQ